MERLGRRHRAAVARARAVRDDPRPRRTEAQLHVRRVVDHYVILVPRKPARECQRGADGASAAVTVAVVMIVAAISPHDAWEQPILRAIDTGVGIAVGLAASSIALRLTQAHHRRR